MAHIKKTKDKYQVQIRKKSIDLYATFNDLATAELWAFYKESLIDQIKEFDVPLNIMFTLRHGIELKSQQLIDENRDKKTINDMKNVSVDFHEFLDKPFSEITYDNLMIKLNSMTKESVYIGGNREKMTGLKKQQSISTVLKKFRCLSAVYSFMIDKGVNIENYALRICQYIYPLVKSEKAA